MMVAVARLAAPVPPHHPDGHVGDQSHGANEGDGEGRHEDVVVADVRQLVSQDTLEFDSVELFEQTAGD